MTSAILVVITTFFHFGKPTDKNEVTYIGGDNKVEYRISMILAGLGVLAIPLYLLIIPCCCRNTGRKKEGLVYDEKNMDIDRFDDPNN